MLCWRSKGMLLSFTRTDSWEVITSLAVWWNQVYNHCCSGENLFPSSNSFFLFYSYFYTYLVAVLQYGKKLVLSAAMAVIINQDNQYQPSKQEASIMIKHKWECAKKEFQELPNWQSNKCITFMKQRRFFFTKHSPCFPPPPLQFALICSTF